MSFTHYPLLKHNLFTKTSIRVIQFCCVFLVLFLPFKIAAQTAADYPWLDDILSENCCTNQTVTAYDFGSYSFVYIDNNENCAPGGKLYFEDGVCWCEDQEDDFCSQFYNLNSQSGVVLFECGEASSFTPFDQFDWLSTVANEDDCDMNSSITVYSQNRLYYVFVESQNGNGQLYTGTHLRVDSKHFMVLQVQFLSQAM